MHKIKIGEQEYIRVTTIREEIRYLRKSIDTRYHNFDEEHRAMVNLAYNDIVRAIYREELAAAKTPEEITAILEMPGDFIVIKGTKRDDLVAFQEWKDGNAVIGKVSDAMWFDYESKAEEIAEQLGDGWRVMDMSVEDYERTKRFLNAIFEEDKDGD